MMATLFSNLPIDWHKQQKMLMLAHLLTNRVVLGATRTATAIHIGKHRVPSDPRSQANDGAVSTMMGDRMGILRAVVFVREARPLLAKATLPRSPWSTIRIPFAIQSCS